MLIIMFILAQLFGLLVFSKYTDFKNKTPIKNTPIGIQVNENNKTSWIYILLIISTILIGTAICLYLISKENYRVIMPNIINARQEKNLLRILKI